MSFQRKLESTLSGFRLKAGMTNDMRWYQHWWAIVILGLGAILAVFLLFFLFLTVKYWWQIKKGEGQILRQTFYGNFDRSIVVPISTSGKPNKTELEADGNFLGNPNGEISIVEFIDFKCPNSKMAAPVIKEVARKYGFKVKITVRHFPASLHPGADKLARLAVCAGEQGRFWQMHDLLFDNQDALGASLSADDLKVLADTAYVDQQKLSVCLDAEQTKTKVNRDYTDAIKFGVQGTPTFFVNGTKVEGAVPLAEWERVLGK